MCRDVGSSDGAHTGPAASRVFQDTLVHQGCSMAEQEEALLDEPTSAVTVIVFY
jgi:hypothetical protein